MIHDEPLLHFFYFSPSPRRASCSLSFPSLLVCSIFFLFSYSSLLVSTIKLKYVAVFKAFTIPPPPPPPTPLSSFDPPFSRTALFPFVVRFMPTKGVKDEISGSNAFPILYLFRGSRIISLSVIILPFSSLSLSLVTPRLILADRPIDRVSLFHRHNRIFITLRFIG